LIFCRDQVAVNRLFQSVFHNVHPIFLKVKKEAIHIVNDMSQSIKMLWYDTLRASGFSAKRE
jgi:hypothetical protein